MKTTSVSELKAHLSAQLRRVKAGEHLVVLEHRRPVAVLSPYAEERLLVREPDSSYEPSELAPLTTRDPGPELDRDREERW